MHSPVAIVEPLLGHFEVVVGQIAPKESLNSALGRDVIIGFKGLSRPLDYNSVLQSNFLASILFPPQNKWKALAVKDNT